MFQQKICLCIGFIFFFSLPGFAQVGELSLPVPAQKSPWSFKAEMEMKTSFDKERSINGYTSEADFRAIRWFNESWGAIAGSQVNHSNIEAESESAWNEISLGVVSTGTWDDFKWRAQMTYNTLLQDEERLDKKRNGALQWDVRGNIYFSSYSKLRWRLKHAEYLPTELTNDVDIRQSKLELSPSLLNKKWAFGLKNQMAHLWNTKAETNSLDFGPFVKYEGKYFEPLLKVIYQPYRKTPNWEVAEQWASSPVYAAELEINY